MDHMSDFEFSFVRRSDGIWMVIYYFIDGKEVTSWPSRINDEARQRARDFILELDNITRE